MKKLWISMGLVAVAGLAAAPTATQSDAAIVLSNAGASYRFDNSGLYQLKQVEFNGRKTWPAKFELTYNLPGDRWFWETRHEKSYHPGAMRPEIRRQGDVVTLKVAAHGKKMSIVREYTLKGNSPELEVRMKLAVHHNNTIHWLNLLSSPFPAQHRWLRLLTSVGPDGRVQTVLRGFDRNPLVDAQGNYKELGNYKFSRWNDLPLVGSYDSQQDVGALLVTVPEKSMFGFQLYYNRRSKRASTSVTVHRFNLEADGTQSLEAVFKIIPFTGDPRQFTGAKLAQLIAPLQKARLIPVTYETGAQLPGKAGFKLFRQLADQRVFRNAPLPVKSEHKVKLFAAQDEGESFQLVVKPEQAVKKLELQSAGLSNGSSTLPVKINAISYRMVNFIAGARDILGNNPDVLQNEAFSPAKGGENVPFLVGVKVPANAQPGIYRGQVEVVADGRRVGKVPVELRVWNFSLVKAHLTAALDVWYRSKNYPKAIRQKVFQDSEKMLFAARGSSRWLSRAYAQWDPNGELISVDWKNFDRSVDRALKDGRQLILIPRNFMIGYGHTYRDNFFGKKSEIMTPLWQKKVLSFAQAFKKHMVAKKWNDMVVIDLFDEPYADTYPGIIGMVKLLRSVDPSWRFTLAGNYAAPLHEVINYWNVGMSGGGRLEFKTIRDAGGEPTVYNPNHYNEHSQLPLTRSNYMWLFNENITYIYQWVVNCWSESGYRGWDSFRCASWIVPGPRGPLGTLRLEATRNGIEDYEYLARLAEGAKRLKNKNPQLAQQAEKLLAWAKREVGRTKNDEINVYGNPDPSFFERFHLEAGQVLDAMSRN